MDYWELVEIEEFFEKPERKQSFSLYYQIDDKDIHLKDIVALSPHLSEAIDDSTPLINEKKHRPMQSHKEINSDTLIGTLTYDERQVKLQKYKQKKKNRVWNKKINYSCRKKVAENRMRVKGRFVTKEQALVLQKPSDHPI